MSRVSCPARSGLDGQVELLALHDLGPVDVEEVGVKDGLDEAGDDGDGVEEALHCVSAVGNKSAHVYPPRRRSRGRFFRLTRTSRSSWGCRASCTRPGRRCNAW